MKERGEKNEIILNYICIYIYKSLILIIYITIYIYINDFIFFLFACLDF